VRRRHGGCWSALVAAVVASVAWVSPASAETTLQVDAGYAGSFVAGQAVPVRVRVSADRLMRGTLEVGIGSPESAVPVAMPVEVPGGSQKEFLIVAPSGMDPAQSPDVVARLLQDGQIVGSARVTIRSPVDTEIVGLLPGALRGRPVPGPAPLAVDAGTARFAAVGGGDLEQAPASLGPLSTLVADLDEIGRLAPGARAGVLRWIEDGGRLLVDAARGQVVPGLPDAWQPGPRGRAAAGLGEVVATAGAVAAGRWSGLVEPSGRGTASGRFGGEMPLASTLAADAGLRTPEIGWLVGFLVAYVVVAGPVVFFAVRRRGRPELAWVAVPLVALLFTSGSWAVGRNLRKATELVHASILSTGTGGPVASTYVGVFSRSGETARIGFPSGWSTGTFADVGGAATPNLVTQTSDGPEARLALTTGQFGMVQGSGPASVDGAGTLQVNATSDAGGRVTGSVRNTTPFRLDGVALFVGSDAVGVGALSPGEERPFSVLTGQGRFDGGNPEFMVWGALGLGAPDGMADFALWQAAQSTAGLNLLSPDSVVAAGWTKDFVPDVRVGGRKARPEGRTVVLGRADVRLPATGPATAAARRDIVRDPFSGRFGRGAGAGAVVRFVFPDGADTSNLTMSNMFGSAEIWQDGAWQAARCEAAACQGPDLKGVQACNAGAPCPLPPQLFPGAVKLVVPAAAVRDGVAYIRVPGPASIPQPTPLTLGRSA
jgi:hypothetical protein